MRVTPSVAREAGRSHNPLSNHCDIVDAIKATVIAPGPGKDLAARLGGLEADLARLPAEARSGAPVMLRR